MVPPIPKLSRSQSVKILAKAAMSGKARSAGFSKGRSSHAPRVARGRKFGQTGPEIKYTDTLIEQTGLVAGHVVLINGVAQGLDNINRVGRKTTAKSIEVKGTYVYNGEDTSSGASPLDPLTVRWAIVLDKQPNGVLPAYIDIFSLASVATTTPWCMRNPNGVERFQVLGTDMKTLVCNYAGNTSLVATTTGAGNSSWDFERFISCDIGSRFELTTNVIGAIETGAIYFVDIVQQPASGLAPNIDLEAVTRVRFLDE